ncbi:MAG TPA: class I SAM-dependent methyltransferase [Bdellovibrionota bacterium]|jgi:16S rRNA (guanine1516-N2)-methyltransferase
MPEQPNGLVVWSDDPEDSDSEKLAKRLHVAWDVSESPPESEWLLFFDEDCLYLHSSRHPEFRPITVDYLGGEFARRWRSATKNDILVKAIGLKKGVRTVCDATCGLGYDAFFLSTFPDLEVTACERSPVAAELVMDALSRAKDTGRFEKHPLYFHFGDSLEFLHTRTAFYDAVFLDPMYPRDSSESAKPKKEMLLFRELVGEDMDNEALFQAAWKSAAKRVVVKRSDNAEEITKTRKPDFVVPGKTVRFDIYLKNPTA